MAKQINRTAISAGKLLANVLTTDEDVMAVANHVFPIVVTKEDASLPYICYKQSEIDTTPTKSLTGARNTTYEVDCFAESYGEAVDLAELVFAALDHKSATFTDKDGSVLHARSITLVGGDEGWSDDAFYKQLMFEIKV